MNTAKTLVKNLSALSIAEILSKLLLFVLFVFVARYLGAESYGAYSFVFAFTGLFIVFSDFGMSSLIVRELSANKNETKRYLSNILPLKAVLSLITFSLIVIAANVIGYPGEMRIYLYIAGFHIVLNAFTQIFMAIVRAHQRMEYEAAINVLGTALLFILCIFVIAFDYGLIGLFLAYLASSIFRLILFFGIVTQKFARPRFDVDREFIKGFVKKSLPFVATAIVFPIFYRIDIVMLSHLKGNIEVGIYTAGYRFVEALASFAVIYAVAIFPVLAHSFKHEKSRMDLIYEKSLKYIFILTIPVAVGTVIIADKIIMLVLGDEYIESAIALKILIWLLIFVFLNGVFGVYLASIHRQGIAAITLGSAIVINIILNLLLIPEFSYVGAAISTLTTQAIISVVMVTYISRYNHKFPEFQYLIKPVVASIIMGIAGTYFIALNLIYLVVLCTVVYLLAIYVLKCFSKEDVDVIRGIFRK
jgi:O-antigen/teichoic acid export membrane protein